MTANLPAHPAAPELDATTIAYAMARNAVGEKQPLADVLQSLGLDIADMALQNLLRSAAFKTKYARLVDELKETGESFKLKARVQAEALLATQWGIIHDKAAPHAVRLKGIENVVEWADLKPKKTVDAPPPAQISISIDLGAAAPEKVVVDVPVPALPVGEVKPA